MQESQRTASRPTSLHVAEDVHQQPTPPPQTRPQRPTSLFKTPITTYHPQTLITPTGDPQKRLLNHPQTQPNPFPHGVAKRFDSYSDLNNSHSAMIRPNCLTRRTSYRTYQKVPIPVAAPMSPVGSDYSFDLKSPTSSACFSPLPRLEAVAEDAHHEQRVAYESSLKSTCSSQHSSKASSTASAASMASSADLSTYKLRLMESSRKRNEEDSSYSSSTTETAEEDSESHLIKNLNFVSPKSGVYRPLPEGSRRYKQSCNVM